MTKGIIYVMWNELFPELVKIGVTSGSTGADVEKRRRELSCGANMPQPFVVKFAICVNNYQTIEKQIHKALSKLRHNPHREFFRMTVEDAITLLSSYIASGGATEVKIQNNYLPEEKRVMAKTAKQRNAITFKSLSIPIGAKLFFVKDDTLYVRTRNDSRRVTMPDGKKTTLSLAAKIFRDKLNPDNNISGLPDGALDFMYNGKTLWDISLEQQRTIIED